MSIGRRILDGVNSVMDGLAADDTPLSHVDESALRAELQARIDARASGAKAPRDNARVKWVGAAGDSRKQRELAARARAARVGKDRGEREAREREFREREFREAEAKARRAGPTASRSAAGTRASGQRRRGPRMPFGGKSDKMAEHYKTLDLPPDATWEQIRQQYRKLMRKYHPDRHGGNPKKQKAATELTMRVTQAYNELEQHLKGGPNKS